MRQAESDAHQVANRVGRLARGPDLDPLLRQGLSDRRVRLHRHVLDRRVAEVGRESDVGGGERGVEVALSNLLVMGDVRVGLREEDAAHVVVLVQVRVHEGSAVGHRLARIEDRGDLFVFDADQPARVAGDVERVRRDGHHRLALIAHDVARKDALVLHVEAELDAEAVAGQYRTHAGQSLRFFHVDAHDPGRGVGRGDERGVKHSGKRNVVSVRSSAGDLVDGVLSLHRLSYVGEFPSHGRPPLPGGHVARPLLGHRPTSASGSPVGGLLADWPAITARMARRIAS